MTATENTPAADFNALIATLSELSPVLTPALAARYEAPPGMGRTGGAIPNPTLDIVADPRRWELSLQISRTAASCRAASTALAANLAALDTALSAWEGRKDSDK